MYDEAPRVAGRVLVGIDGSEPALAAARWGAGWARLHGQALTLVTVVPPMPLPVQPASVPVLPTAPEFTDQVAHVARAHLEEALGAVRAHAPDVDIAGAVVPGHAAAFLADLARDASLTVLGATGASRLRRALLGGTVAAVLHHAEGNVVVVPARGGDPAGPIIAGLDASPHAQRVAQAAITAAAALGRRLLAVQVWDLTPVYPLEGAATLLPDSAEVAAAAQESLAELTRSAVEADVSVERLVRFGRAQDVLHELAETACLLVVGSRGHGGFAGLLLGSVSRAVTTDPQTPTLVVRI